MHRHANQRGAALILLLGITATLALLSATLVFVLQNEQRATARERSNKQSFYVAEAALDTAVQVAKTAPSPMPSGSTATEWLDEADLRAAFQNVLPAGADPDFRVYDNLATVDYDVRWDQGGPSSATTPDGMVWVETTFTYQGRQARTRVLVRQQTVPFADALPKAVTYSDTGIKLLDQSDIYAVNADGSPDTSGPPYQTSITAGGTWLPTMPSSYAEVGRFTANSSSDLAAPGTSTQSLGITTNGSVSLAGHAFDEVVVQPGSVGFLSDYFDQAAQTSLAAESRAAYPVRANAAGTSVAATQFTPGNLTTTYLASIGASFDSGTKTYTFTRDLVVTGDLTLRSGTSSGRFPSGTTFKFRSLYLAGSLSVTGQISLNTTALYVGSNFTISGATTAVTDWLGSVFVKATPTSGTGDVVWSGAASVTSRNYLDPTADPQPMWLGRYWERTGTYNDEYGPVWVPGNSSTSIVIDSSNPSTIMSPLLCSTEKPKITGAVTFGSRTKPMVYFYMCDNNGIYPMTFQFGTPAGYDKWYGITRPNAVPYTGTFYGLLVINEAPIEITGSNAAVPSVQGAIFAGCPYDPTYTADLSMSDITLRGYANVAYDQSVVGKISTSSLKTTTLITQIVPGSWQQLPVE